MAKNNLEIIIKAQDQASDTLKSVSKEVDQISRQTNGFGNKIKNMGPAFEKLAGYRTLAASVLGVGFNKAIDKATDLGESMNAVEVIFGKGSKTILDFGNQAAKSTGLSKTAFYQMSTEMGALLGATGLNAQETADKTLILTKRASDMASVFNVDVATAMDALNQGLRGETEGMRKFASDVTDASLQSYLLSQGIDKSVSKMSQQEKSLLRLDKMMSDTNVTQGDFINTADSLANRQRVLAAQTENTAASFGKLLAPIKKLAFDVLEPLVGKIGKFIDKNPKLAKTIAIVTAGIVGLVAIIGTLGLILPSVITGVSLLGSALMFLAANPIGLIITGIAAVIAAGIYLYKNWDKVSEKANNLGRVLSLSFKLIGFEIKSAFYEVKNILSGVFDWISNKSSEVFTGVKDKIVSKFTGIIDFIKSTVNGIESVFSSISSFGGGNNNVAGARAYGGPVSASSTYLVGEKGPELFTPSVSGNVVPNNKIGGGTSIVVNITGNSIDNKMSLENISRTIISKLNREISTAKNFGLT